MRSHLPRSRRLPAVALLCAAAVLMPTGAAGAAAPKKAPVACADANLLPGATNLPQVNAAVLCLVNQERTKRGLRALKSQPTLGKVAMRFAADMVRLKYFSHVAPDGATSLDRVRKSGYLTGYGTWSVGENIAAGTGSLSTPSAAVKAWMKSPGHRANILRRGFRDIGLGVHLGTIDGTQGATYANEFGLRSR